MIEQVEIKNHLPDAVLQQAIKLINHSFKYKLQAEEFIYLLSSDCRSTCYCLFENNDLLGLLLVVANDAFEQAKLASYLVIAKRSDRLQLYQKLTDFCYLRERQERTKFLFGIANKNAAPLHKRIGGWQIAKTMHKVVIDLTDAKLKQLNLSNVCRLIPRSDISTYEDWRFENFPFRDYYYLSHGQHKLVMKDWLESGEVKSHLMLHDCYDETEFSKIIKSASIYAKQRNAVSFDFYSSVNCFEDLSRLFSLKVEPIELLIKPLQSNNVLYSDFFEIFAYGLTDSY